MATTTTTSPAIDKYRVQVCSDSTLLIAHFDNKGNRSVTVPSGFYHATKHPDGSLELTPDGKLAYLIHPGVVSFARDDYRIMDV